MDFYFKPPNGLFVLATIHCQAFPAYRANVLGYHIGNGCHFFAQSSPTQVDQFRDGRLWKSLFFFPMQMLPILGVGWTLSHEMLFYLMFSVKVGWRKGLYLVVVALFVFGGIGWIAPLDDKGEWYELVFSPFQLEFLLGLVCGWLYERRTLPPVTVSVLTIVVLAGLGYHIELARWVLWGGIGLGCCLVFLKLENAIQKTPRFLLVLGDSSYALYLSHLPVLAVLMKLLHLDTSASDTHRWLLFFVAVFVCEAFAIALWKFFDNPVQACVSRLSNEQSRSSKATGQSFP